MAAFPWVCLGLLVALILGLVLRSRNQQWLSDLRLRLIAQPRINVIGGAILCVVALAMIALGVGFLEAHHRYGVFGLGFLLLAAGQIVILIFCGWVAKQALEDE